jgi:hypothetical protein
MASPTSRCAILLLSLLSLLFADTAALRLGAAASHPRRARLYLSLPRELLALNVIPAAVAEAESTAENWAALRECFPTEAEALAAVEKNPATLLPYGFDSENRAENIRGSYGVLQDVLESEAEVQEVLVKNPGVLGCIPRQLAKASADDIKRAASVANGFDAVLGPAKRFLNNLPGWDESANEGPLAAIEKGLNDARADIGEDLARARGGGEEEELALPELTIEGVGTFLYDAEGEAVGVEHALFTEDGEPWGVYDPETGEAQEAEFVDE